MTGVVAREPTQQLSHSQSGIGIGDVLSGDTTPLQLAGQELCLFLCLAHQIENAIPNVLGFDSTLLKGFEEPPSAALMIPFGDIAGAHPDHPLP